MITWIERKQSAVMQDRIGANRADIGGITVLGLLHPLADVIKLLSKEDVVPAGANRFMHLVGAAHRRGARCGRLRGDPLRRRLRLATASR